MIWSLPRIFVLFALLLFSFIGVLALFKGKQGDKIAVAEPVLVPIEIKINSDHAIAVPSVPPKSSISQVEVTAKVVEPLRSTEKPVNLPEADRIQEFFQIMDPKLPIVQTLVYKSHVPWQKGRPAWLSDYANHYHTSRHFIARSLNGKPDYLTQEIKEGDRFNVFRDDKPFEFYLLVDTSRCKMWFYYIDLETREKVLLKSYDVGLGRVDSSKTSGLLTPLGKYTLGDRIATYKPKMMGTYQGKKTEMVTIFGTRWIPFDKEIGKCTAPARGFGIHGTPWQLKGANGQLVDSKNGIGKYESDGCIRLSTEDIEELFSIIVTKPTTIEIVPDFFTVSNQ